MILPGSYANGFAPRDGQPLYSELWRGCVGAWAPCLGPTGLTLRDWSGYGNHGTLTNGPVFNVHTGKYAVTFDGVNDFVSTSSNVMNMQNGQDFTVSCWFRSTSIASDQIIVSARNNNPGPAVAYLTGSKYSVYTFNQVVAGSTILASNTWYHGVTVHRGTSFLLYVNGRQDGSSGTDGTFSSNAAFLIGSQTNASFFSGQIDDVRLYNRALTEVEIRNLASRRGIAYELAQRRRASVGITFNRRRRLLVGAGS